MELHVILSEQEYNKLKCKEELCKDIINKIGECFEVTYNNDGDTLRNIKPTVKEMSINIDKVIELASTRIREAAKEKGTLIVESRYVIKTEQHTKVAYEGVGGGK